MAARSIITRLGVIAAVLAILLLPSGSVRAGPESDVIAYVRPDDATGDEIRLIRPDGTGDSLLWSTQQPGVPLVEDISRLAWRPDAGELAFAGRHEEACSFYNSDVYAVRPDGRGYRRVTAPPACGQGRGLPTGTVSVPVANESGEPGPFVVYFEGAPGPQAVALPEGGSTVVTFEDVVDFGDRVQWAVASFGEQRYQSFDARVDVQPGAAVQTGALVLAAPVNDWGWRWPTYRSDGARIATVFGPGILYAVDAANTTPGDAGAELLEIDPVAMPLGPKHLAWSPAPSQADQLLYVAYAFGSGDTIFLVTEGSATAGDPVIVVDGGVGEVTLGLAWLPDGSGLVFSATEGFGSLSNIFEYRFASADVTRLTDLASGYTRHLSVSPDGQQIVFELQPSGSWTDTGATTDLWLMNRDGSNPRLLVPDGRAPAWSPAPPPRYHYLHLPALRR